MYLSSKMRIINSPEKMKNNGEQERDNINTLAS